MGHLFVTRGDIRHLACSAWLLPTDSNARVERVWLADDERLRAACEAGAHTTATGSIEGWGTDGRRIVEMLPKGERRPAVWLGNVGGHAATDIDWYLECVREFIRAGAEMEAFPDPDKRDRPLIAIPLVGTGAGGLVRRRGDLAGQLINGVGQTLREVDVDVVLVTNNPQAFAAAQWARRKHWGTHWETHWAAALEGAPGDLSELIAHAERLGAQSASGKMVAFVGAGLGVATGMPLWDSLLDKLAEEVGLAPDEVKGLDHLDKAAVIEASLRNDRSLGEMVVALLPKGLYSLSHSLLAATPSTEFVTTNYDDSLEQAGARRGQPSRGASGGASCRQRTLASEAPRLSRSSCRRRLEQG